MSQLFGVGLNIETNRLLNDFRMKLQKKPGMAMRGVSIAFCKAGDSLSSAQLETCLSHFNIFPTKVELQTLMKSFGEGGQLSTAAFLAALRPQLAGRRKAIVDAAWAKIDADCAGQVSLDRLMECYDVSQNGDFMEGKCTKEELFKQFCDGLSHNGQPVDCVRQDVEWKFYQEDMALTIVNDEYFVGMTQAVWGIQEDCTATVKKQEIEHLVSQIRKRCRDLSSVNQSEEAVLRAVYREVDGAARSNIVTNVMFAELLKKLQIAVDLRYLDALMKPFDRNKDGVVEFEELVGYLMEKPYK
jgi:Ca2+-binding EF-hand superfamily protein